jgi:hypothetical protein
MAAVSSSENYSYKPIYQYAASPGGVLISIKTSRLPGVQPGFCLARGLARGLCSDTGRRSFYCRQCRGVHLADAVPLNGCPKQSPFAGPFAP